MKLLPISQKRHWLNQPRDDFASVLNVVLDIATLARRERPDIGKLRYMQIVTSLLRFLFYFGPPTPLNCKSATFLFFFFANLAPLHLLPRSGSAESEQDMAGRGRAATYRGGGAQ